MNILITGATDGIGLALAHHYAATGARLILVGRRALATLEQPFFTAANYCQSDLNQPTGITAISTWLHEQNIQTLDLVLHNAGVGYMGTVAQQSQASIHSLLQVNLWSPIALTHLLFPHVQRARGKFVYISSVATGLPTPDYAVYTATKAALEGFVRSWQIELAADRSPVRAQIIRPGATRTQMHEKSGGDPAKLGWQHFPTPETVANQIVQAIATERRAVTLGILNRLVHWSGLHLPALMDTLVRRRTAQHQQSTAAPTPPHQPHCVITGAADGIGRALAQTFAAAGYTITGIDVDAERAAQTATELRATGAQIDFIQADLATVETLPQLLDRLTARGPIDLFIHNAGISAVGPFEQGNLARQQAVLTINLAAPLLLTAGLLAQGKLADQGGFVFISSLSHFASYPGAAVYAASKDGIAAYARSLGVALAAEQHHVLTVYPGPTRTAHARRYSPDNRREERRMAPAQVAASIEAAFVQKRRHLVPGAANRLVALLGQLWPQLVEAIMRRTLYDRLRERPPR